MHAFCCNTISYCLNGNYPSSVEAQRAAAFKGRFVCRLQLVLSAWCQLSWEEICSLNEMHLAIRALSALQWLLAMQILHVIRADGIDKHFLCRCMLFNSNSMLF